VVAAAPFPAQPVANACFYKNEFFARETVDDPGKEVVVGSVPRGMALILNPLVEGAGREERVTNEANPGAGENESLTLKDRRDRNSKKRAHVRGAHPIKSEAIDEGCADGGERHLARGGGTHESRAGLFVKEGHHLPANGIAHRHVGGPRAQSASHCGHVHCFQVQHLLHLYPMHDQERPCPTGAALTGNGAAAAAEMHPADGDAAETDAIAEERLRLANVIIGQLQLPLPGAEEAAVAAAGRAILSIDRELLGALVAKGTLRIAEAGKARAVLEVLPTCLRLSTAEGGLALRATVPLDPAQVAVPAGGLLFETDLGALQTFSTRARAGTWRITADLSSRRLTFKKGSSAFRLPAAPSARRSGLPCDGVERVFQDFFEARSTARSLRLCAAAADGAKKGRYPVVEIAGGIARGGHPAALMVVRQARSNGVRFRIGVEDAVRAAHVLRHMQPGAARAYDTERHALVVDDVVELSIEKPTGPRPPAEPNPTAAPVTATTLTLEDITEAAIFCDLVRTVRRREALRQKRLGRKAPSNSLALAAVERSGPDVLGIRVEFASGWGRQYLTDLVVTQTASTQDLAVLSPEAASPPPFPMRWGSVDSDRLERVLAEFGWSQAVTVHHHKRYLSLGIENGVLQATCYLPYANTQDARFKASVSNKAVSNAEESEFERNVALFGSAYLRQNQHYVIENAQTFLENLHRAQGFSAPAPTTGVQAVDGQAEPLQDGVDRDPVVREADPAHEAHSADELSSQGADRDQRVVPDGQPDIEAAPTRDAVAGVDDQTAPVPSVADAGTIPAPPVEVQGGLSSDQENGKADDREAPEADTEGSGAA